MKKEVMEMIWKPMAFELKGVSPLLMHNAQLANPLNKWTKAIKEISGKRKKTEDDLEKLMELEWYGGLYTDSEERVILPSEVLLASFIDGAKQSRLGKQFKCGFEVPEDAVLEYEGPKDIEKLWKHGGFVDVRGVCVQRNRIMRTRPIFYDWSAKVGVQYRADVLNESQVEKAVIDAGTLVGICDYRPRYGRFIATRI